MDELKVLVATTALKDMITKGYLNICTIRKINEVTGNYPAREDMALLEALHCVNFGDMPAELQRGMPLLIQKVLGTAKFEFDYEEFSRQLRLVA